jgi:CheY-like chemotaxis protein
LVEDHPVNREVALGMLESLGYRTHAAANGAEAIEAHEHTHYAAILMDCQMPILDGFNATAEIRRRAHAAGRAPAPIIALTANAMAGDREHCLTAGMDDFLSKPFTLRQLGAVLARNLRTRAMATAAAPAVAVQAPRPRGAEGAPLIDAPLIDAQVIDAPLIDTPLIDAPLIDAPLIDAPLIDAQVLENIIALARPRLLDSLIALYFEHSPPLLAAIDAAARGAEPKPLGDALHTLKSSTANLGGARLARLLKECESLARQGAIGEVSARAALIRKEYAEFCAALSQERAARAA